MLLPASDLLKRLKTGQLRLDPAPLHIPNALGGAMNRALTMLLTAAVLLVAAPATATTAPPKPRPSATVVSTAAGPAAATVLYIAGDSIMASWYLNAIDSVTNRLSTRICGQYCNTPGYPTIVNVAQGGQRLVGGNNPSVPDLSVEWPSILARTPRPTTIVVAIGINDMGRVSNDVWAQAYRTINQQAADAGIRLLPCTMAPVTTWFSAYNLVEAPREQMNSWIRSYFGSPVCDFDAVLKAPNGPWEQEIYNNGDGIHPSPYGVMRMADVVPFDRIV